MMYSSEGIMTLVFNFNLVFPNAYLHLLLWFVPLSPSFCNKGTGVHLISYYADGVQPLNGGTNDAHEHDCCELRTEDFCI